MKWASSHLGEFIDVKHGFPFESQFFSDSGNYICLTPGNCYETGGLKLRGDREKYYTGEIPADYLLQRGDLLVVMTDLVNTAPLLGGAFLIPEDDRFLHNQRLGLVSIKDPARMDKRFLYFLLNTHNYRGQVKGSASGATVRHTSPNRILACEVRIPTDVDEQRRIGNTLSAYDDLIENNRRRIQLLEQSARLLYKEWFVHLRFPGHEHVKIFGGLPKGWERKALTQIAEVNRESLSGRHDGEILYIDIASVSRDSINETVPYRFVDAPSRARRVVQHGDILWSCVRPNRRSHAMIWKPLPNTIASTGFAVLTPTMVPTSYLYQAVTTDEFVGYLANNARGVAYPAVTAVDFEKSRIVVPAPSIVREFDAFAAPRIDQAQLLQQQNQKLTAARDLLLPRLMSGELVA